MKYLGVLVIGFAIGFCIVWFPVRECDISSYPKFAQEFVLYVAPIMVGAFVGVAIVGHSQRG